MKYSDYPPVHPVNSGCIQLAEDPPDTSHPASERWYVWRSACHNGSVDLDEGAIIFLQDSACDSVYIAHKVEDISDKKAKALGISGSQFDDDPLDIIAVDVVHHHSC